MYLLGYLPSTGRAYLGDKDLTVVSYNLPLAVLEYQTLVMRGDVESADEIMPRIPADQRTRVAQFLEKRGFKEQALVVSTDPDHRSVCRPPGGEVLRLRSRMAHPLCDA